MIPKLTGSFAYQKEPGSLLINMPAAPARSASGTALAAGRVKTRSLRLLMSAGLLAAALSACGGRSEDPAEQVTRRPAAQQQALAAPPPDWGAKLNFEIQGAPVFRDRTLEALALLEGSESFARVAPYIAVIKQADHSGMRAYDERPMYEVGFRTWNYSVPWYAGTIAHDGYHSLLYHNAKGSGTAEPPETSWTGADAERKCLRFQVLVLREINADAALIKYVQDQTVNPTYQNIEYSKRDW